jgi:enoyl-[acyl-carrier-protein] reductase (NADH)
LRTATRSDTADSCSNRRVAAFLCPNLAADGMGAVVNVDAGYSSVGMTFAMDEG